MSYYSNSASSGSHQQGAYGYSQGSATGQYPQHGQTTSAQHQAYAQAYAHHQQQSATSSSSRSSSSKKDKKSSSSSSRREQATLLEVEKQWAAYYEQQRTAQGTADDSQRYPVEPNFTAFTLAGGKSWLEDGSPSPLSSNASTRSSNGGGKGY